MFNNFIKCYCNSLNFSRRAFLVYIFVTLKTIRPQLLVLFENFGDRYSDLSFILKPSFISGSCSSSIFLKPNFVVYKTINKCSCLNWFRTI